MQTPDIEFLRQFREEAVKLPKNQYKLFLQPISRIRKERAQLQKLIKERFIQSSLVDGLITKIEQEDQALSRQLSGYMKKMLASFSAFVRMDPSSTHYFVGLSKRMRDLLSWMTTYQDETEMPFLSRLKYAASQKTRPRGFGSFCCRDIDSTGIALQRFWDGLCQYYEIFCHYFEQESETSGKTLVVSATGRHLYGLLTLMGKHIAALETTAAQLNNWKLQTLRIEIQEIYN